MSEGKFWNMSKITFKGYGIEIDAKDGEKLSECIRRAGLKIETPCNGIGTCGKCRVIARGDMYPPNEAEKKIIEGQENVRLSCQARVKGDVEVELFNIKPAGSEMKTINRGYSIEVPVDARIRGLEIECGEQLSSSPQFNVFGLGASRPGILRKMGGIERDKLSNFHAVLCDNEIIDAHSEKQGIMGVSIDIGTTGLSAYLVNLETGEVIRKVSGLNPQTEYGGDVLSRITYIMNNENGAPQLEECIVKELNSMIAKLVDGICGLENVYNVVIAGNTTMLHLLLGVDPVSIARAPYRPVFLHAIDISPADCGMDINESGIVTVLPSASGYVGADIVSGIIATGFNKKENTCIFIDIGTNGEIVAISGGNMAGTSTAAGPALEGMNISCGMRAEDGAIESFKIGENGEFEIGVIGGKGAVGICGSGLIDIVAQLLEKEIVMKSGKFNSKGMDEKFVSRLDGKKFKITDEVFISQGDIRQIQLAKGAIATGVTMLLKELGIGIEEVEEAVIAGAFGYHLDPENIKTVGLIPKGFKGDINFVGNSSIEGARLSLINRSLLEDMKREAQNISVLELSTRAEFQDYFIKELRF
ncbi:Uncharacterized 2Fe-2 and 4Fe-4S clusters-containing protein, contains DUF4445 domain [Peptoclostridium litorale DSM 5388]|uniref:Iron-sulfur cluster-binding protein n=2 Tax=Peptoclostridium litorale TaxID=1557 RepID=A0A069RPB9_PEPLI|nr:iron-sulfur cluster-binding protein [Peptoclostridium litorale DSM 5388]SIO06433.1 Uncharacterized 2Fe-2 and 4Fe-4S clusters-containing protein, contains DUF4445 domain [Peptoclostridium litorale DSM 5388]